MTHDIPPLPELIEFRQDQPKNFQIRIAECGTPKANETYDIIKENDPLILAVKAVHTISEDIVGKYYAPNYEYQLACLLLWDLTITDYEALIADIKSAGKFITAKSTERKGKIEEISKEQEAKNP